MIDPWPNMGKKEREEESLGRIDALYGISHIFARASQKNPEKPLEIRDYFCVVRLIFAGVAMGVGSACFFYTSVFIFPTVATALQLGEQAAFLSAVTFTITAYLLSAVLKMLGTIYYDHVREDVVYTIRVRFINNLMKKRQLANVTNEKKHSYITAFSTDLESVVKQVPGIVHVIVLVLVQIPVAISYLDFPLSCLTLLLGVSITRISGFIRKKFNKAFQKYDAQKRAWRKALDKNLEHKETILGLSRESAVAATTAQNIRQSRDLTVYQLALSRLQSMFQILSEKLSIICFAIYFAFMLFNGYMTLANVLIMMPISHEVSKLIATFADGSKSVKLKESASKFVKEWNEFGDDFDQVTTSRLMLEPAQMKALGATGLLLSAGLWSAGLYTIPFLISLSLIGMLSSVIPSSFVGRVAESAVRLNAYLWGISVNCSQKSMPVKAKKLFKAEDKLTGTVLIPGKDNPSQKIETQFQVEVGKVNYLEGSNGLGKSTIFSELLPGKNPSIQPYFESSQSWVIRGGEGSGALATGADPEQTLSVKDELAERFSISKEQRQNFEESFKQCLEEIDFGPLKNRLDEDCDAAFSQGEQQALICSAAVAALPFSEVKYACFDEMTSNIDTDRRIKVVQMIHEKCSEWCGAHKTTVIIEQDASILNPAIEAQGCWIKTK